MEERLHVFAGVDANRGVLCGKGGEFFRLANVAAEENEKFGRVAKLIAVEDNVMGQKG